MARPHKRRRVCCKPDYTEFAPLCLKSDSSVIMSIDEYETIRLIDLEELTQEQCAKQMDIARTTVQSIYLSARKKLANSIVNGSRLKIDGGTVEFCGHLEHGRGKGFRHGKGCKRGGHRCKSFETDE